MAKKEKKEKYPATVFVVDDCGCLVCWRGAWTSSRWKDGDEVAEYRLVKVGKVATEITFKEVK